MQSQWPGRNRPGLKLWSKKAVAAGIPGILADGNDLMAMYAATKEAVERARSGGGPTLIEAYTYRLGAHTTSDDPTKYRQDEEVEQWQVKDPIRRMKAYLTKRGVWSEGDDLSLIEQYSQEALEVFQGGSQRRDQTGRYFPLSLPGNSCALD